jgi:signal transduction histidine kinase
LHDTAQRMAGRRLPDVVERLRKGEDVDVDAESPPPPPGTITEIARVAQAFATVQRTAVQAAVGQANLRKGVNQVFLNLSLRNQSLLHRQLGMLDSMERATGDPAVLADLFRLDHLTTRMRRHAEGLIILSGSTPGRGWRDPVSVVDVLRAAIAEVEDYVRVDVASESHDAVVGAAVNDVIHLVAELIENATTFSPPATRVEVRADVVGTGFAVEIEDRGLGLSAGELADINEQLASPPEFDLDSSDRLGLFVVGQLAARHGIRVSLRESPYGGTTAIVLMPHSIIVRAGEVATARDTPGPGLASAPGRGWPASTGAPGPGPAGTGPAGTGPAGAGPAANGKRGSVFSLTGRQRSGAPRPAGPDPDPPAGPAPTWGPHPTWGPAPPATSAEPLTSAPLAQELPRRAQTAAGTHRGLPRRVRQANLAPQLRTGAQNGTSPTAHPGADITARSPEENRDLMSALQQGWQRGRLDDLEDPAAARDVRSGGPPGPAADPRDGEAP